MLIITRYLLVQVSLFKVKSMHQFANGSLLHFRFVNSRHCHNFSEFGEQVAIRELFPRDLIGIDHGYCHGFLRNQRPVCAPLQ